MPDDDNVAGILRTGEDDLTIGDGVDQRSRRVASDRVPVFAGVEPARVVPGVLAGVTVPHDKAVARDTIGQANRQRESRWGCLSSRQGGAGHEGHGERAEDDRATGEAAVHSLQLSVASGTVQHAHRSRNGRDPCPRGRSVTSGDRLPAPDRPTMAGRRRGHPDSGPLHPGDRPHDTAGLLRPAPGDGARRRRWHADHSLPR